MARVVKLKKVNEESKSFWALVGKLAVNTFALLIVAYVVPGFVLDGLTAAIVTAVILGVVNTFVRPFLQLIALPLTVLTLGLGAFLVNVFILWLVAKIVPGFELQSIFSAILGSLLLTLVSWSLHRMAKN